MKAPGIYLQPKSVDDDVNRKIRIVANAGVHVLESL